MAKKKKRTRDPDAVTFENPLDDVENQDLEQPRGGGFEEEDDTPTHDVKKLKKMNIKKLRAQALKEGLPAGTILDAGNDKGQLIDLIMNGPSDEDGLSWAQKATAAREESGKKDKDAINLDFHEFESEAPKSSNHFEVEVEVAVVDYWLDDPDQSYLPCTNGQKLNIGCIAYSLTLPCLWRLAFGKTKLPSWDNSDPDPDDMQQMLVFDDVNSGRIYMLAPQPGESLHSVQCRNACMYQKLHHPILSIFTTHQFNEFSRFEKVLVLFLGYVLGCFLTEGMDAAMGLQLEEFVSIPALATFAFFKILTAIASTNPDKMVAGLPFGKATDMFLPLAIRGAVFIFFTGMLFYGYKEERFVILNLCRYSNISHENCDDTDDVAEVLPAATLDIMKGMAFEFIFGFTFTFRPRHMRFELFGFIPPSIPGEMYQAHKWEKVKNQRGKMEYQTTWKKPWAYGKNKEKGLVNWMEIRPERKKVAERQQELYLLAGEYAKEQNKKKSNALEKEVEALMSVEEKDRKILGKDKKRANRMHDETHANAVELNETTILNVDKTFEKDVRKAENIVPDVEAAIDSEIREVNRTAKAEAKEAGPGFFDKSIFFRGAVKKEKKAAAKEIKDAAKVVVTGIELDGIQRVVQATEKAATARTAADSKLEKDTAAAHDKLARQQKEADEVQKGALEAAEMASEKRTKSQRQKAAKAEEQADAAAAELEAKKEREAALDKNKDRLREENRTKLKGQLEKLLNGERMMAKDIKRDQWLTALIEAGEAHVAKKAGAATWKHITPSEELWSEGNYEKLPIAVMHAKVDEAMKFLAEAYAAKEGAKRHKEVMVEIATPKKMPGRRQKKLRKAANQRISEAKSDGDDVISKMQENVLSWKGIAEIGLEKMAAEQDLMIINAEQKLENLQEAAKDTAQVLIGFGGRIADIFEQDEFTGGQKDKKNGGKKAKLKGTEMLDELIEKDKKSAKAAALAAKEEEEEEARRMELSKLATGQDE